MKNIAKNKKVELNFENINKLWQLTLDAMSESVFLIDLDHKILQCNKATLDIMGKTSYNEIIGHSCWELLHCTSGPIDWCPVARMKQTGQREATVQMLNDKWVEISVEPVFNDEGELTGAVHIITDINARKKAENALKESEQQYLTILNSLSDAMHVVDRDLKIIYQNPAMIQWLEKINLDFNNIGKTVFQAFPFLDYDKIYNEYDNVFKSMEVLITTDATKVFDRNYFTETLKIPIISEGQVSHIITILRDITEQKEAEQKLKESEEKFRSITEQSLMSILVLQNGLIKYLNERVPQINGYSREEILNWEPYEFLKVIHPEDKEFILEQAKKKQTGDPDVVPQYRYRLIRKDNEIRWVENYSKTISFEGKPADLVASIDITDKIKVEQKLKESEEKYRLITENANDLIAVLNNKIEYEYVNEAAFRNIMGRNRDVLIGANALRWVHPDDVKKCMHAFKEGWDKGEAMVEARFKDENDKYRWLEVKGKTIFDAKEEKKVLIVSRDVSERREAEGKLKESEEQFRTLTEQSFLGIAILQNNIVKYVNKQLADICGYKVEEAMNWGAGGFLNVIHPEDRQMVAEQARKKQLGESDVVNQYEFRAIKKNGDMIWLELFSKSINYKGELADFITIHDITDKKVSEQKLKESEEKYKYFIENSIEGVWVIDSEANTILVNPSMAQFLGYTIEEMIGKSVFSFTDNEQVKITKSHLEKRKKGISEERDAYFIHKNGNKVYLRIRATPIFDKEGIYQGTYAFLTNITQRMQAEQKLRESEEKFRNIFESIPLGMFLYEYTPSGELIFRESNPASDKILNVSTSQFVNKTIEEAFPPLIETDIPERYKKLAKEGGTWKCDQMNYQDEKIQGAYEVVAFQTAPGFMVSSFTDIADRIDAENKLKESEEKYSHLFMSSPYSIIIANMNGFIIDCNFLEDTITGFSKEEIIGKSMLDIPMFPKSSLPLVIKDFKILLKGGIPKPAEIQINKKDGTLVWVQPTASIFKIEGESYIQIIMQEISERKISEERLKESEEKFRTIAEQSFMGIIILQDGVFKYFNEQAAKLNGYSIEEIQNWEPYEFQKLIYPEDREFVMEQARKKQVGDPNVISNYKYRLIKKNGEIIWVENYSKTINYKGKPADFVMTFDISDKIKAEDTIKESEENFRTIAEQAFMGTLIIQDDKVEYVNNALLQIFDFSHEEIDNWRKEDLVKLIYPEDLQYLREYRERLRAGESDIKPYYSYRVFTKYGKLKWIDQFSRPIIYRGKPAEIITIMDVTEKKKAEQELIKLNNLKSELLRRTSHELKTPLVSIKGFSDLLLTVHKEKLDDYVLATIHEIKLGCERLESLIQDILKTSELETESVELKKSEEDLSFLIKLCVKELQGLIRLRNHEIHLDIHDKLTARFEPDQLHLVVSNLLNNAIKYTPPNGKISINSAITDEYILISIEDNGIGITSEEKRRLFTQFGKIERYGQGLDIISEGSGLGLYITKKIIELHGGTIRVRSKGRNKGSTFYFTLPIS